VKLFSFQVKPFSFSSEVLKYEFYFVIKKGGDSLFVCLCMPIYRPFVRYVLTTNIEIRKEIPQLLFLVF
jgi:hypothetical protein